MRLIWFFKIVYEQRHLRLKVKERRKLIEMRMLLPLIEDFTSQVFSRFDPYGLIILWYAISFTKLQSFIVFVLYPSGLYFHFAILVCHYLQLSCTVSYVFIIQKVDKTIYSFGKNTNEPYEIINNRNRYNERTFISILFLDLRTPSHTKQR